MYVAGEFSRAQKKGRSKMDFEKLYNLSSTVKTWTDFLSDHTVSTTKISCMLYHGVFEKGFVLSCYENEFYYLKKYMEELILKYKELEKFYNENNINGL